MSLFNNIINKFAYKSKIKALANAKEQKLLLRDYNLRRLNPRGYPKYDTDTRPVLNVDQILKGNNNSFNSFTKRF